MKKFKICLACILAILCAASVIPVYGADAAVPTSGQCGENVFWNLDSDGTLTISGEGEMYNYYMSPPPPWKNGTVNKVIIEKGVTSIGNYAFSRCKKLTSVSISDSVERIGSMSFDNCTALTEINIPDSVTEIPFAAFRSCSSLTSVTIPGSVKTIGSEAFRLCEALTSVNICNGVEIIGGFEDCTSLEEINIPNSVTKIDFAAFRNCSSLTSVTIPGSVKMIGSEAFRNCKALTDVFYNNTVENWDKINVLNGNDSLLKANISFLDNVPCGDNLYWTLDENGTLTISGEGEMYNYDRFYNSERPWDVNINDIRAVIIEEGVTSIGDYAFHECWRLSSISIPSSVKSIGAVAFSGCTNLEELVLPEGVVSIGESAFSKSELKTLSLPASIEQIDEKAFYMSDIESIEINEDSPLYSSKDGVLFSKDGTELVCFPAGRTGDYTISDGVETVCPRAFSWFELDSLTIPSGVMFFEKFAFKRPLHSSFKIYYEGTEEQWNNMFVGAGNDDLLDSEVVCFTYGDTDGSGGIDLKDSCAMKALIMGAEADESSYRAADMNNDGRIDTIDASMLKRMLLLGW